MSDRDLFRFAITLIVATSQLYIGQIKHMKTILIANRKGGCGKSSVAITLAAALANQGHSVALADADPQQSSLQWLNMRPKTAAKIFAVDWQADDDIGELPKKVDKQLGKKDWLIIDAPGSLSMQRAQNLISEAKAIVVPVLPSVFDVESTKQFLAAINDIKRIRKGKVDIHLLANRIRAQSRNNDSLKAFFDDIGQQPLAWISERSAYPQLAQQGLSVFDHQQKRYRDIQAQWQPVMDELMPKLASQYETVLADSTIPESLQRLSKPSIDSNSKLSYQTANYAKRLGGNKATDKHTNNESTKSSSKSNTDKKSSAKSSSFKNNSSWYE